MKKICLFIFILIACLSSLIALYPSILQKRFFVDKKEIIYIALAGPMTGESKVNGMRMIQGVRLFQEEFNKKNKNYSIELLIFDDKYEKRRAVKIASEIIANDNILLVLGHYDSETSAAAGEVYKKIGMPVITASATADIVTENNKWYFRLVSGNRFAGSYIANYIFYALKKQYVSIIYDVDYYGTSLVEAFENSVDELGITIKNKWGVNTDDKNFDMNIKRIITEIRAMKDTGVIFLALHGFEAARIIAALKYPGIDYTIIGSDALSSESCINYLKRYPKEKIIPGYHSDDIYSLSHFMIDLSNEDAYSFRENFIKKYQQEPSWISATYYDAIHMAMEAIERSEIHDNPNKRECRKLLREALTRINSAESGLNGVCGLTYFNTSGDVTKSLPIGVYNKQHFIPVFYQYKIVADSEYDSDVQNDTYIEDRILVDGKKMQQYRIVFTGIDINKISNSNMRLSTCEVDFFIWFRFAGEFDDKQIEFTNAITPIVLKQPIMAITNNNISIRAYRVKGRFKTKFDFYHYPIIKQTITISINNTKIPKKKLIYVPDKLGMPDLQSIKINENLNPQFLDNWNMDDMSFYQTTVRKNTTTSDLQPVSTPFVDYSQFKAIFQIETKSVSVIIRSYLPILAAVLMLYMSFLIPSHRFVPQLMLLLISFFICRLYHFWLNLFFSVPYILLIEYMIYAFYVISALSLLYYIIMKYFHKYNTHNMIRYVSYGVRVLFIPVVFIIIIVFIHIDM